MIKHILEMIPRYTIMGVGKVNCDSFKGWERENAPQGSASSGLALCGLSLKRDGKRDSSWATHVREVLESQAHDKETSPTDRPGIKMWAQTLPIESGHESARRASRHGHNRLSAGTAGRQMVEFSVCDHLRQDVSNVPLVHGWLLRTGWRSGGFVARKMLCYFGL